MESHTILVVDDEPASLRALRRALAEEYRILDAGSGADALRVLDAHPVSVIVTDQRMPGMSGVELLARSLTVQPDAVRIILTGYTDAEAIIEAINAGKVYHYVTKPWFPHDLRLVVRRGVERLEAQRERERLIRELEAACRRVRCEAEQKTRMLATAAHELGTPVHLVSNAVGLLGGLPEVRASQWLQVAERGVGWLGRSLAQMQTAVRLREPQIRLTRQRLDLADDLGTVVAELRDAIAGRDLTLEMLATPPLVVCGDRLWLRQLWIALLSNAVRFTADRGDVRVSARPDGPRVEVRIADTGVGMSPEQLAAAFEPFSAASGDLLLHTSGRFDFGARGLGLGLSIARRVVELHGGSIDLDSTPGCGTRVTVRLPARSTDPR